MNGIEVKVLNGPYKQHKGIIKKFYGDRAQIELTSKQTLVMLSCTDFQDVRLGREVIINVEPNSGAKGHIRKINGFKFEVEIYQNGEIKCVHLNSSDFE